MQNQNWYVQQNGRVDGPMSQDIIELRIRNGIVGFETLVSTDGKKWDAARTVFDLELFEAAKQSKVLKSEPAVEKPSSQPLPFIAPAAQSKPIDSVSFTDVFEWELRTTITPAMVRINFKFYIVLWSFVMLMVFASGLLAVVNGGSEMKVTGVLTMVFSILFWYAGSMLIRMAAEKMLLGFNMYEELKRIGRN